VQGFVFDRQPFGLGLQFAVFGEQPIRFGSILMGLPRRVGPVATTDQQRWCEQGECDHDSLEAFHCRRSQFAFGTSLPVGIHRKRSLVALLQFGVIEHRDDYRDDYCGD
jgi:hypothetical protein